MDDLIFWSQNESDIDNIANLLIGSGLYLEEEGDAAGFICFGMEFDG